MASKRPRQAFEADWQKKQEAPFVLYGTPLPSLDDGTRDDGSYVPIWKQEVTDERGRKRLHGAFTGGFSAGYFNTVGSKEGWTPSSFVSSRQQRQQRQQRPEDFMDEEDLREAEESRQLTTADRFSGFGTEHDQRRRATLKDIFRPAGETAGVRLLKRMGWKEGQGIGPKIKRKADLGDGNEREQLSGGGGDGSDGGDGGDGMAPLHTFAPDDVPMLSFVQKNDKKGLGFEAESKLSVSSTACLPRSRRIPALDDASDNEEDDYAGIGPKPSRLGVVGRAKKLPQKNIRGGIGVGILNDTGSDDDEDPYSMGPKISYNKTMGGGNHKKTKKKPGTTSASIANPAVKSKPVLLSKKLAGLRAMLRKCHDGRLPLDGFVLGHDELDSMASLSLNSDKYKPPTVPVDWKSSFSNITFSSSSAAAAAAGGHPNMSVSEAARSSQLDAKSRAAILGEASLPGKSVFDFLSPAARDRLAAASGRSDLPPGLGERPTTTTTTTTTAGGAGAGAGAETKMLTMPLLSPSTALEALNRNHSSTNDGRWMPYSEDPAKQQRYKEFLETMAAGAQPPAPPLLLSSHPDRHKDSKEECIMEQHEFARAAQVFRPVSGAMASRFTTSSWSGSAVQSGDGPNGDGNGSNNNKKTDPAADAARMGMFGHLTRSYLSFYPTRLLCKRFGVPMPAVTGPGDAMSAP